MATRYIPDLESHRRHYIKSLTAAYIVGEPGDQRIAFLNLPSATLPGESEPYTAIVHPAFIRSAHTSFTQRDIITKFIDIRDGDIEREAAFHLHHSKSSNNPDYAAGAQALYAAAPKMNATMMRIRRKWHEDDFNRDIVTSPTPTTSTP